MNTTRQVTLQEIQHQRFFEHYLKADFLGFAVEDLFFARKKAKLTQEKLAERLGRTQEGIARWEADLEGKMSLAHYCDIALALGLVPRLTLIPIEQAKAELIQSLNKEKCIMTEHSELLAALERIAKAFTEQNEQNAQWIDYVKERDKAEAERVQRLDAQAVQWREEDRQRNKDAAERLERNTQAMHDLHSAQIDAAFQAGKQSLIYEIVKKSSEQVE